MPNPLATDVFGDLLPDVAALCPKPGLILGPSPSLLSPRVAPRTARHAADRESMLRRSQTLVSDRRRSARR